MNIFGAFTFGSLIKTFLPGLVGLIAICLLEVDVAQVRGQNSQIWSLLTNKDQAAAALVLAFPASILLGLLFNIIVFMGLNDWLVRNPFEKSQIALSTLHKQLCSKLREQCWTALGFNDPALRQSFDKWIDPEIIIVERLGAEKLGYVREQYWYHLEFQLNLVISLIAILIALIISAFINTGLWWGLGFSVMWIVIATALCGWLLKAARKNYTRHIAKMASLMTALLSQPSASAGSG